jgi:hypothetical protein
MNDQAAYIFVYELWNEAGQEWAYHQIRLTQRDCLDHDLVRDRIFDSHVVRPGQGEVEALRERVVCGAKEEDFHVV